MDDKASKHLVAGKLIRHVPARFELTLSPADPDSNQVEPAYSTVRPDGTLDNP